jgi:hypothetical protein
MRSDALLAGLICAGLLGAGATCPAGENGGEKLLKGFEVSEMKPKDGRGTFYKVGKVWNKGGVGAGWRWKDHQAELKVPEDYEGDVTIYVCKKSSSRDNPGVSLFRKGATQGTHALRWRPVKCEARSWAGIERAIKNRKYGYWPPPGVPTHSRENPYYFFQRYCKVWRYGTGKSGGDWSGWDRLRFDVLAPDAPVLLGVFVRDKCGPRLRCGPIGVRTDVAVFRVPKGEQVTVDFPLAEMAAVAELDLRKVYRYQCRINGYQGATDIYFDNVRLAKKDAPAKHKLVTMEGKPRAFVRPVYHRPIERVAARLKRETGPVEKLGPVDVGPGKFGGSGATYVQNSRRACVAYDNRRLLVVADRSAWASFDGGKTWGGIEPGSKGPTRLRWGLRANMCADYGGDVYLVGTPNCDSYNEGHDICMFRLVFTGEAWKDGYFAHIGQNGYKCTAHARALRLKSGRLWAAWCDGWGKGAALAKYSDDDGFTWTPCKDADAKPPRPFLKPKLADLAKPAERAKPPKNVLLWPATIVPGPFMVPYRGGVAAFDAGGGSWRVHDGEKWGPKRKGPKIGGIISEAILGEDQVFLARGARFAFDGRKETVNDLVASRLVGGEWKTETLDAEKNVTDSILTASGESVFCFYVKKLADEKYEIHYRRWKAGKWEPAVKLHTEPARINRLAAPQRCAPDYAAVWWDMRPRTSKGKGEMRFARIPNK